MPILPILLSDGYIPAVNQTEHVRVGQVLAKKSVSSEAAIHLATELGIPPKEVGRYLKKNPGDSVQPGDIIAIQKGFLGGTKEKVISTTHGIVTRYDRESGTLYIHVQHEPVGSPSSQPSPIKGEGGEHIPSSLVGEGQGEGAFEVIISPIDGTVSLCNNEKILLETDKDVIGGTKGQGSAETEEILVLPASEIVATYHLEVDAIGKIVVGHYFSKEVLAKAISMGVKGVIGTKLLDIDLVYLQSHYSTIPIIEIVHEDHKKLTHWNGKKAFIHGTGKTIILLHA